MFNIGDKVVYPMHGAGTIVSIEEKEMGGDPEDYYIIKMPVGGMKLMVPTSKVEKIGIREVSQKSQADKVFEILEKPKVTSLSVGSIGPNIKDSSSIFTIRVVDLKDGLALIPGKNLLSFISPTIFIFKVVLVLLTISPTILVPLSSKITCKFNKLACLVISIVKSKITLLSTISLIVPNTLTPSYNLS